MDRKPQPCGTRAAFIRHVRNGQEPCLPCRETSCMLPGTVNAYQAHLFLGEDLCAACQAMYEAHLAARAAGRAHIRLAELHSAEFAALVAEERAKGWS